MIKYYALGLEILYMTGDWKRTALQKLVASSGEENACLELFIMNNNTNKMALILQTGPLVSFLSAKCLFQDTRHYQQNPALPTPHCPHPGSL